jgi:hypothetical protein
MMSITVHLPKGRLVDPSPQGLHDVRQGFSPPITADHDPSPQGLHDVWQGLWRLSIYSALPR